MPAGLIVKLRPTGPWRSGPDSGARHRVDPVYHSDSVYAAVTSAMAALGLRDEWLDSTARNAQGPAVQFSSCFPFQGDTNFVVPPRSLWPPAAAPVTAARVRWRSARFIPLPLVAALQAGQPLQEDQWAVDGASECLLHNGQPGPFRINVRWSAGVDRLNGNAERHATACIEFRRGAGLWAIAAFADDAAHERWAEPVRGAFRLLADSGFGGERSRGWGRCEQPEFIEGALPEMILPLSEPANEHWLLSLFTPAEQDQIDWTGGNYTLVTRSGRIDSPAGSGERKKQLQMVTEGSVLVASSSIRGAARNVAPDGFAHPVFRAGFALSIPLHRPSREETPAPAAPPEVAA